MLISKFVLFHLLFLSLSFPLFRNHWQPTDRCAFPCFFFRWWSLHCVRPGGGLWPLRVRGMCRTGVCAFTCAGWFWRDEFYSSIDLSAVFIPLEFGQFLNLLCVFVHSECWDSRGTSKKKVGRPTVFGCVSIFAANRFEARCELVNEVEVRAD